MQTLVSTRLLEPITLSEASSLCQGLPLTRKVVASSQKLLVLAQSRNHTQLAIDGEEMYRKPFRTPFVKANKRGSDEENQGAGSDASGTESPPKKKFKQEHDGGEDVVRMTPVSQSTMRPLLSLKSSAIKNAGQKVSEKVQESDTGTDLYFNVLWRKYTAKKYAQFTDMKRSAMLRCGCYVQAQNF